MTELAALNIRITGDAGDLKAAVATATGELGKVKAAANAVPSSFNAAASSGGSLANSMRGVSQQLSQVGQQTMATGNFVQALAIQLPDIGVAFGAVGAAAGLLAGIALPLLINAFSSTSEKAAALAEATNGLAEAAAAFRIQAEAISLGIDQEEVAIVREVNSLMADLDRINKQWQSTDSMGARQRLAEEANAIKATIAPLQKQLDTYRQAREELAKAKAKADDLKRGIGGVVSEAVSAKDALAKMVATAPSGGWLSGAISDAATLATKLWDAAAAQASLSVKGSASVGIPPKTPEVGYTGGTGSWNLGLGNGGGGGGGGGGGENPLIAELEALQSSLVTQEQAQIDSFTRQQETLVSALDQRLITQQEYAAMMEEAQQQHADAMSAIDVYRYGTGLQQAGQFMGDMANAFASGNDKMIKISRAFAATQGLIDAYGAYLKALNAPGGMTPLQRIAMAASVLAAGMKAVSAIKGGGGVGGGGAAAVASAGGVTETRTANINFYGGFQPTQETISAIASGLNDWLGDGGRLNMGAA